MTRDGLGVHRFVIVFFVEADGESLDGLIAHRLHQRDDCR